MSEADLLAAVREASEAAFGPQNLEASAPPQAAPEAKEPALVRPSLSTTDHLVFLGSMAVGGLLSAVFSHGFHPSFALQGVTFAHIFGTNPIAIASVLLASGLLVGFGTRMAGGCTSGHGLCGVSRFQVGSVLATCAFFGTAVAVSLAMTVIR